MVSLGDLKRRKLVQWLLAYLAAAWAAVQVADVVGSRFGWPDSWVRSLIVILAVGAIAVIVLAWYHGERGAQRVSMPELAILTAVLVFGAAAVAWLGAAESESAATVGEALAAKDEATLAVLPFANLSGSEENEYFSDGITEEILAALGRSHRLRVISRTSVMQYKDTKKPLRQIAGELGVTNVLEGSVRRHGDKVRVTAQLIDARTDQHLWAENYDRRLEDIFAIQTDIAERITAALHARLTPEERSAMIAGRTSDIRAYDIYLRAQHAADSASDIPAYKAAAALYHEALRVDSTYALAYAGLSDVYAEMRFSAGAEWQDSAYAAARKALALAPQLSAAHAALGNLHWYFDRYDEALDAYRSAIRLDPNSSMALRGMAFALVGQSELEAALPWALRATLVDPADFTALTLTGTIYWSAGDFARAERWFLRSLAAQSNDWARHNLVRLYIEQRRLDEAERVLAEFRNAPEFLGQARARIALARGDYAGATALFERFDRSLRQRLAADMPAGPSLELAYLYARTGERERTEAVLDVAETLYRQESIDTASASFHLHLARICALRSERTCALDHVRQWADGASYRTTNVRDDPMLETIRDDPEFQRSLARVDARGEALRKRLAKTSE